MAPHTLSFDQANLPPLQHGVNLTTPLLTPDGFPRADIDVAQIRTTRARIIHLKNDHKALMARIEKGLHERHAEYLASPTSQQQSSSSYLATTSSARTTATDDSLVDTPFAKINTVAANSPAALAGLLPGDKLRRIGHVTWLNHEKLSKVAEVVNGSLGREVSVKVSRTRQEGTGLEELELKLVPRSGWGGRGVLGCHLLPI